MKFEKEKAFDDRIEDALQLMFDFVGATFGPFGKNVLISRKDGKTFPTKDGVTVARHVISDDPQTNAILNIIREAAEKTLKEAGDGPQPLYSKVLTPNGFVEMGSLKVGDKICGTNNSIQEVVGVYPKGVKRIYKLHFSNDRIVECCLDHLWNVVDRGNNRFPQRTLTTKQLIDSKIKTKSSNGYYSHRYYTPLTSVDFHDQPKELDPFLVGLLIGDGSLCSDSSIELSLSLYQEYILDKLVLPENIKYTCTKDLKKNYLRVKFSRKGKEGPTMHEYVRRIGLLNKKSKDKFIPKEYLYASYANRMSLLDGLTESDGYVNSRGHIEYSTVSSQLCQDFTELMRGLGRQVNVKEKKRKGDSYSDTPIFVITELKGYKFGVKLKDIEETDQYTEMMCIKVSNPDSLYITNDYVVTHNTTSSIILIYHFFFAIKKILNVHSDISLSVIKEKISSLVNTVCSFLEKEAKQIDSEDLLRNVAFVSSNGDKQISDLIVELIDKIGIEGSVLIKDSKTRDTSIKITEGFKFESAVFSNDFLASGIESKVNLGDCVVISSNAMIQLDQNLLEVMNKSVLHNKSLLFVCPEIHEKALMTLMYNVKRNPENFRCCVVCPASMGAEKLEIFEDVCLVTGGTLVTTGKLPSQELEFYGTAKNVQVSKTSTIVMDGGANQEILDHAIKSIKEQVKESEVESDQVRAINRLNRLNSCLGIIFVGAQTDAELTEKKHRIEDALEACNSALRKGVVAGGGVALLRSADHLQNLFSSFSSEKDFKFIFDQVCSVLKKPSEALYGKLEPVKDDQIFDLRKREFVDPFSSGLLDVCWNVQCELLNSFTTAWMLCTCAGSIVES